MIADTCHMSDQTTERSAATSGTSRATPITVVHAEACHFCTDAGKVLEELGRTFAIDVHSVRTDSDEGRALAALHRPAMSPLVLVDGEFFSHGRLPRKKLTRVLTARSRVQSGATSGN